MADKRSTILDQARERGIAVPSAGMKVPEGYFADFAARMNAELPDRPELERPDTVKEEPRTVWQRVRPYVYMAAMFAGIWLMLQMFSMMGGQKPLVPLDDNVNLAKALESEDFLMDYLHDDIENWSLVDEMIDDESLEGDLQLDDLLIEFPEALPTDSIYILPQ